MLCRKFGWVGDLVSIGDLVGLEIWLGCIGDWVELEIALCFTFGWVEDLV